MAREFFKYMTPPLTYYLLPVKSDWLILHFCEFTIKKAPVFLQGVGFRRTECTVLKNSRVGQFRLIIYFISLYPPCSKLKSLKRVVSDTTK